jgi:hypothetical protein
MMHELSVQTAPRSPLSYRAKSQRKIPFSPVMLSEVGAHATTQSKHPGAAGSHNANTGSSTEIAHSDTFLRKAREPGENSLNLRFSMPAFSGCFDSETRPSARLSAQHDRCRGSGSFPQPSQPVVRYPGKPSKNKIRRVISSEVSAEDTV